MPPSSSSAVDVDFLFKAVAVSSTPDQRGREGWKGDQKRAWAEFRNRNVTRDESGYVEGGKIGTIKDHQFGLDR